jgi:methionyl-tRNA formyltransferase
VSKGRIIFMGSPEFARPSLQALLDAGYSVPLVLSQPDRPSGRGRKLKPTAISAFARDAGLPLETPETLRDAALRARVAKLEPDLFVVIAYRLLPPRFLRLPRLGAINLHASLLPAYRGAAPIQHALMDGQAKSGLSTFLIDRGVDTGGVLRQHEMPISANETAGELHDRMMDASASFLMETVDALFAGTIQGMTQEAGDFPLAPKLTAETRQLNFSEPPQRVHNRVRALSPTPAATCKFRDVGMKILRTQCCDHDSINPEQTAAPSGSLWAEGKRLFVTCGGGCLEVLELAPAGRRSMPASAWLSGVRLEPGEIFHF